MNIRYTAEAIEDLSRLRQFIAEHDPAAARRVALELRARIGKLRVFPRMGIRVSRAPDPESVRDLFIGPYVVRYLLAGDDLFILRVWHGKEDERNA